MSSAEGFARMWEKSTHRATFSLKSRWCTHAGATLSMADFDGDGRTDLLCRDPGRLSIDYADADGSFSGGTDWFLDSRWCTHSGATLSLADANGDGRTDLICRDPQRVSIDYADANGHFANTTDWFLDSRWCTHSDATLSLADFNGDGRTDLLCRDPRRVSIDYADANGHFADQNDWFLDSRWCTHSDATLSLADFNGDGRTDFLCRDPRRLSIDYADANGHFADRNDWFLDSDWCTHRDATFSLADLNGDGRTDLVCRDPRRISVDYADANGHFANTTDWFLDSDWCTQIDSQIFVSDINGDGREDLLCRNQQSIEIHVAGAMGHFEK
jgi:tRNA pseudouridine-54 N-methylase